MINTFDKYISGRDLEKALNYASTTSFHQILEDARLGSITAINYIFYSCKKQIAAAFFKYFLGPNRKYWKSRIQSGDADIFAAEVYGRLADTSKGSPNPLRTFNPDTFPNQTDDFLMNKLGYYVYYYSQSLAGTLNNKRSRQGLVGDISAEDNTGNLVTSYDNYLDSGQDIGDTKSSFEDEYEASDMEKRFLLLLQTKYPKIYPIIKMRTEKLTTQEIAKKIGKSDWVVNDYTLQAKKIFKVWAK